MEPKKKGDPYFENCTKTLINLKKTKKFLPNPKKTLLTFYNPAFLPFTIHLCLPFYNPHDSNNSQHSCF